jgi:hypothetical protein
MLQADTLYLRDGRTLRGTFISGNSRELRFLPAGGRTQRFSVADVDRLAFGNPSSTSRTRATDYGTVPAGAVVTVRMIDSVDSSETDIGRKYRATLDDPLVIDGRTIAPRSADATVEVTRVDQGGEEIALVLTEIVANGPGASDTAR